MKGAPLKDRKRKPSLETVLKSASKAGKNVKVAEVYADRYVLTFGDGETITTNPWDEVLKQNHEPN